MPVLVAAVSVALATLMAVAAYAGPVLLAGAVVLTVACLALGWTVLVGVEHSRRGTAAVVGVSGLAAAVLAYTASQDRQPLGRFAVLLAACVLLAFVQQLLRGEHRPALVESLTGTVSGQVIAVLCAGWLLLADTRIGREGVVIAAVAVAASGVALALPVRRGLQGWVSFAAGLVAALVAVAVLARTGSGAASLPVQLLLGAFVAAVAAGTALLLSTQRSAHRSPGLLAAGAAPVCAVGTAAYAVARLSGG